MATGLRPYRLSLAAILAARRMSTIRKADVILTTLF